MNYYAYLIHLHTCICYVCEFQATRICAEVFRKHPKFTTMSHKASFLTLSSTEYCGKMQTLEKLLETFHRDKDKVIIFSMSVKVRRTTYFSLYNNYTCIYMYLENYMFRDLANLHVHNHNSTHRRNMYLYFTVLCIISH